MSKHDRRDNATPLLTSWPVSRARSSTRAWPDMREAVRRNGECKKPVHRIHKHMIRVTNHFRALTQTEQRIAQSNARNKHLPSHDSVTQELEIVDERHARVADSKITDGATDRL